MVTVLLEYFTDCSIRVSRSCMLFLCVCVCGGGGGGGAPPLRNLYTLIVIANKKLIGAIFMRMALGIVKSLRHTY